MKGKDLISFTKKHKDDYRRYVERVTDLRLDNDKTLGQVLDDYETKIDLLEKELAKMQVENDLIKEDVKELQIAITKILDLMKVGK